MLESLKPLYHRGSQLGEQLVADGLITPEQLDEACKRQTQQKKRLGETLIQMGCVAPDGLWENICPPPRNVSSSNSPIFLSPPNSCSRLPNPAPANSKPSPFKDRGTDVMVAMADPLNLGAIDEIAAIFNRRSHAGSGF